MRNIRDLDEQEKADVAFLAWECVSGTGSRLALLDKLRQLGLGEDYIKSVARDREAGKRFRHMHPIFSMARIPEKDVLQIVPRELYDLCPGCVDGWFSDSKALGEGVKWVCQYNILGDEGYNLYFCFGFPFTGGMLSKEYTRYDFKSLVLYHASTWYVQTGYTILDFPGVWDAVGTFAKPLLSWSEVIKKFDMQKTPLESPLNYC